MTVVGIAEIRGTPTLFGDVVVSSPNVTNRTAELPIRKSSDAILKIHRMTQKIYAVSDFLALGFAGNAWHAHAVLTDIKKKFAGVPVTAEQVLEELKHIEEARHVQIVGLCLDQNSTCTLLNWQAAEIDIPEGRLIIAGSGGEEIAKIFKSSKFERLQRANPAADAFGNYLSTVCVLCAASAAEVAINDFLEMGFGGAYQDATIVDGRIVFPSYKSLFFWHAHRNENGENAIDLVPTFIFHTYFESLFLVVAVDMIDHRYQHRVYALLPLDIAPLSEVDVNADAILNHVRAENSYANPAMIETQFHAVITPDTRVPMICKVTSPFALTHDSIRHRLNEDGSVSFLLGNKLLTALRDICFPNENVAFTFPAGDALSMKIKDNPATS